MNRLLFPCMMVLASFILGLSTTRAEPAGKGDLASTAPPVVRSGDPKVSVGEVFRGAPNLSAEGEAAPFDPSGHPRVGDAVEEAPSDPADQEGFRGVAADSRLEVEAVAEAGDSPRGWKQPISRVRNAIDVTVFAGRNRAQANPPLTPMICPVIQAASSEQRKATTRATSSGSPMRPMADMEASCPMVSSVLPKVKSSVRVGPGATALTVIFLGPTSLAKIRVNWSTAALVAAYAP